MIWFGLVLWHINHCRLFNAKSILCIYIKYMISKHILSINQSFVYAQLNVQIFLSQTTQFSINTHFKRQTDLSSFLHTVKCYITVSHLFAHIIFSIWSIDRTLSGDALSDQSRPGSDISEGVFPISKSSNINGASPSDCLMSYRRHSFGESYLSADMQSVYSANKTGRKY